MRKVFEIIPNIGTEYFYYFAKRKTILLLFEGLDSLKSTYIGNEFVGWEAPNLWRKKRGNSLNASLHEVGVDGEEI